MKIAAYIALIVLSFQLFLQIIFFMRFPRSDPPDIEDWFGLLWLSVSIVCVWALWLFLGSAS